MIPDELWPAYGGRIVHLARGETLFDQGATASSFFQVRTGRVKMVSCNDQGREFVQGLFTDGQSFGEPPFFNHVPYPAAAVAVVDSEVWTCGRAGFLRLLAEHPEVHLELTRVLSGRLVYKSMMLAEIAVEEAEHRLATLIEYLRDTDPVAAGPRYRVPFTRQQLADMTGLRVETVVRSVKAMAQRGLLEIEDGKIWWLGRRKAGTRPGTDPRQG
jgi:CRP-like cAMP-binding protein